MRRTIQVSAVIATTILIAMAFHAWLASHDEQLRMQTTIATQKQQLDAAAARERARATALDQTLAQIQKLKRDTQTPEDILKQLPQYLTLPQPITLKSPSTGDDSQAGAASPTGQGKKQKGTGFRLFGKRWFASKPGPAGVNEPATPTATNSSARSAENSNVDSASHDGAGRNRSETQDQTGPSQATAQSPASVDGKNADKSSPIVDAAVELPDAPNGVRTPSSHDRTPVAAVGQKVPGSASAQIPAADLKPLYDYVQDCRSCQAQLAAAQQNRADDASKLTAITHERDAALTAAKGGTLWRRFRRNLAWFAVGAAAGAVASAAAHAASNTTTCPASHCR